MSTEVELKLRLPPSQVRRLQTHPVLSEISPQKYRLLNTYYDTPELDLRRRGIALRLRRKDQAVWLMTVKGGDSGAGGLAQRSEWEAPTQPGVFDFTIVTDQDLREFLELHHSRLQAVFSTDFTRTAWTLNRAGALIELALDRGKINTLAVGDGRASVSEPLCEVELELVKGESLGVLFDLAMELAADIHLHPEILSKAERGYVLADGACAEPVKAIASQVIKSMSPVEAFRSIALSCLVQLQRNEAGAIFENNPEYVHQARMAIRRLRSAFNLFSPVLAPAFVEDFSPRWRELAEGLGIASDWDVFLTQTLAPLEEAFPEDADLVVLRAKGEMRMAQAQASAGTVLTHKAYSQLLLAFSAALFRVEPPTNEARNKLSGLSLRKFARRRLQKRAEMIEGLVREHGKMNTERRHELRIAFKKLHYALEFFTPVLPRKRLTAYLTSVTVIQDLLGKLNDQVAASRLIKELHPKGERDSLTQGWIAGRTQLLVKSLGSELRRFVAGIKPWR
ncbi:CHAD domain-containing protein [Propionivibrio sp.]|uniref:CYTH and CHAD domain-containing protein n=1 Tax=Propionivibrio sp. TaxID=2212460 RepID=UPI003BEFB48D